MNLKGQFPFRVGAPSFVFPADIVPNVRELADYVDDIEIVLFESDAISPLPDGKTILELAAWARGKSLTYTVHLPLDADAGSRDEAERRESVQKCLRAITRMAPVDPLGYVLHWPASTRAADTAGRASWHAALSRSVEQMLAAGVDPRMLCIETLDYPFEWVEGVVETSGLSVCLDVGHLLLHGQAVEPLLERHLGRTRIIHLHAVEEGKDHRSISAIDPDLLSLLFSALHDDRDADRVVTLEVFNEARLRDSLDVLAGWVER